MTIDSTNSLTCDNASCPGMSLWLALLDEQRSLSNKMDVILQTFKGGKPKANDSRRSVICRVCVNELVVALQMKYPDKDCWTSVEFAKIIGCTASAVRKTRSWKEYQERQKLKSNNARSERARIHNR